MLLPCARTGLVGGRIGGATEGPALMGAHSLVEFMFWWVLLASLPVLLSQNLWSGDI